MRPIDADALIEDLRYDREYRWYGSAAYKKSYIDKSLYAEHRVEKAPTIDVAPVVHARWVRDDLMNTRCSNCSERLPFIHCYSEETDEEWDDEIDETPWCMHCGARMDGESDD